MAYIIEFPNPFNPLDVRKHQHEGGITIRDWIESRYPGFVEFPHPTLCSVNGKYYLRAQWSTVVINSKDVVAFTTVQQGVFAIVLIAVVALIALSISLALTLDSAQTPGELPASDPVFSTKGQTNAIRLGEPIEVNYGRNRIYPSFASRPFFQYWDNDQFQYALFCIGQGQYEIEQIQIGDTAIEDFQEVEWEIIPPGGEVTLFPTNVITSIEVGGQTLFAPNEPEYTGDGWVGPFPANSSGTLANEIQVDITFPKGIYSTTSKGNLANLSIAVEIEARLINDAGAPLGSFFALTSPFPYELEAATTTPQRRTIAATVAPGRYEVRVRRTDTKETSHRAGHEILWEGMRSYVNVEQDFGDVTLLAVIIRATNNLNDRTQVRFNVIATRMLQMYESGGWTDLVATRSIVWAFVDVFRSAYGGRITDDSFFDFDTLEELDALYEYRDEHFDWTFRDPITVWEAARTVARVGRAVPLISGSLITMKREGPLEIPVALFNRDNIVAGSFDRDVKLWDIDEFDSVNIEYTEVETGYKQEIVECILPGGTNDHPKDIRLPGCQDRTHAYHEGMYMAASMRYLRENISFETGLEGHIITFGDLIAISCDITRWGISHGIVVHATQDSDYLTQLWLSEPVDFTAESGNFQIYLRKKDGSLLGPFDVFETEDPKQVAIQMEEAADFLLGGSTEPMLYVFGVAGNITKLAKVVKIEPRGGENIGITAVNDAPVIHSFDSLSPSPLSQAPVAPQPPDLPEIDQIYLTQIDGVQQIIQVAWTSAFGAQYYVVQTSEDGVNYQERINTTRTSIQLQVRPGPLWVRVAAVNNGQGPWVEEEINIGVLNGLENHLPWEYLEWGVRWWEVLNATGYQVRVYDNSGGSPVLKRTSNVAITTREYEYDYAMAVADGNLVREMLVTVDVEFEEGLTGEPAELELTNAIPPPPTGMQSALITEDSEGFRYLLFWSNPTEDDLIRVKVWLEVVPGFDPDVETPVFDFTAGSPGHAGVPQEVEIAIPYNSDLGHDAYYWRVAVFDAWGNEIDANICVEQTIDEFVP